MSARNAASPSTTDMHIWLDGLEKLLRAQLEGHQRLRACIARKRQAISAADMRPIQQICAEESTILRRLNEHEHRRLELIAHLGRMLHPRQINNSLLTITEIANHAQAPEAQRARLLALASELRELLADIKKQSSIVRSASEALTRHMSGIVQSVQSALSRAGVYGQRGTLQTSAATSSVLDLKS